MSAWFKMEASMKLKTAKEKRVEIVDDIEIVHDSSIKYEEAELAILKVDTISTFDIYIKRDNEYYLVLYQNQKITQSFIENLKQSRYEDIYTPMEQSKNLIEYMEKSLNDNKEFLREKKSAIIYTTATSIVDDLFKKEITVESLNKTKEVVHQILDNILKNDVTIESLIKVTSYDYYTYTHSVDVSVYSLGIGKELGLREYDLKSYEDDFKLQIKNGRRYFIAIISDFTKKLNKNLPSVYLYNILIVYHTHLNSRYSSSYDRFIPILSLPFSAFLCISTPYMVGSLFSI
jgi:hypothetical protein